MAAAGRAGRSGVEGNAPRRAAAALPAPRCCFPDCLTTDFPDYFG